MAASRKASELCYVVASVAYLDGRMMPFREALLELTWNAGFISCVPGRLGCYLNEYDCYVLERS